MSVEYGKEQIKTFDSRRNIALPGDRSQTLLFCVEQLIAIANQSLQDHGFFTIALSGGSTPKSIFQSLALPENRNRVDWSKVKLFWSDERSVPPTDPESNYKMAMEAGFSSLPIPTSKIFRMRAETDPEHHARQYESLIKTEAFEGRLDFMMLGMGEDGHTASLFPHTHGLHSGEKFVVGNYLPEKNEWRMTVTYECIHRARNIVIYVLGSAKADMVGRILLGPEDFDALPIQRVGTPESKALWVMDPDSAKRIL